jgi:hypothetical protein
MVEGKVQSHGDMKTNIELICSMGRWRLGSDFSGGKKNKDRYKEHAGSVIIHLLLHLAE